MARIFDQDGPLIGAMNTLTAVVGLNILTAVYSIPVVTAGAAFASMHYIIMQYREGTEGKMIPTFRKQFRSNLKTATPVWLLLLAAALLVYGDYRLISSGTVMTKNYIIPIAVVGMIIASVFVWAMPLLGKFENSFRGTLKNALLLAVGNFPRTVTMLVVHLLVVFLFTYIVQLLPLLWLMGISLPAWISSHLYWPVLKKLIPEEPEADASEDADAEEAFESEDAGAEETGESEDAGPA